MPPCAAPGLWLARDPQNPSAPPPPPQAVQPPADSRSEAVTDFQLFVQAFHRRRQQLRAAGRPVPPATKPLQQVWSELPPAEKEEYAQAARKLREKSNCGGLFDLLFCGIMMKLPSSDGSLRNPGSG